MEFLTLMSWIAIIVLASSYWFQIWKIYIHKEVRDLSLIYHFLLAFGFGLLIITAFVEDSTIFLVKQVATFIPVLIIIGQIIYHQQDHWHDDEDEICRKCAEELEPHWKYCAYCSKRRRRTPSTH